MAFTKWENATTENGQTVFALCFDQLELCLICPQGAHQFFWRFTDVDQSYTSISLSKNDGKFPSAELAYASAVSFITGKCGYWDLDYALEPIGPPAIDTHQESETESEGAPKSSAKFPIYL